MIIDMIIFISFNKNKSDDITILKWKANSIFTGSIYISFSNFNTLTALISLDHQI